MQDDLHQLIYCSRGRIRAGNRVEHLQDILHTARHRNEVNEITGILTFTGTYFAQLLEGPHAAIHQTFARIQNDPRHDQIVLLRYAHIAARHYTRTPLAFTLSIQGRMPQANDLFERAGIWRDERNADSVHELLENWVAEFRLW